MPNPETPFEPTALVDTLRFRLVSAVVVPRRDVRVSVSVTVTALVSTTDTDRAALEQRARETLDRFIPAQWTVLSTEREKDATGYERVTLNTTARVPLDEDHNLEERARLASREGLSIANRMVDYELPNGTLDAGRTRLQKGEPIPAFAGMTAGEIEGRRWRVGDIEFGIGTDWAREYSPKFTKRENAVQSASSTQELLMTSERLMLVAQVTLKADANGGH